MVNQRSHSIAFLLVAAASLSGLSAAWADPLSSIRFGESARAFAAGAIQMDSPQDGAVNLITGDNQTVGNRMRLGQGDVFYIKLKDPGAAKVGNLYTVFTRTKKVFHPATGKYLGFLINRLAVVQVVQVDEILSAVKAVLVYGPMSPGDPVVKFSLPVADEMTQPTAAGEVSGMVVDIQSDMKMTLVAQRNIVYLDRGSEDGLRIGNRMDLVRHGGGLPPRKIGEIRVISTEEHTATALITKSTSRVLKGDHFLSSFKTAEVFPLPVSLQPAQAEDGTPSPDASASAGAMDQGGSREARYNLSDFMKQLRFESGEATIKPEGYQVLNQLIERLKQDSPGQLIRVEGHADSMEIGPSLLSTYPTNWDLSKARAGGVVRYLMEKGGIDSARISSIGYADTKPLASNATEAGRQQNRRVEIVLYSPGSTAEYSKATGKPSAFPEDMREAKGQAHETPPSSNPAFGEKASEGSVGMETPAASEMDGVSESISALGQESFADQNEQTSSPSQP